MAGHAALPNSYGWASSERGVGRIGLAGTVGIREFGRFMENWRTPSRLSGVRSRRESPFGMLTSLLELTAGRWNHGQPDLPATGQFSQFDSNLDIVMSVAEEADMRRVVILIQVLHLSRPSHGLSHCINCRPDPEYCEPATWFERVVFSCECSPDTIQRTVEVRLLEPLNPVERQVILARPQSERSHQRQSVITHSRRLAVPSNVMIIGDSNARH